MKNTRYRSVNVATSAFKVFKDVAHKEEIKLLDLFNVLAILAGERDFHRKVERVKTLASKRT